MKEYVYAPTKNFRQLPANKCCANCKMFRDSGEGSWGCKRDKEIDISTDSRSGVYTPLLYVCDRFVRRGQK